MVKTIKMYRNNEPDANNTSILTFHFSTLSNSIKAGYLNISVASYIP